MLHELPYVIEMKTVNVQKHIFIIILFLFLVLSRVSNFNS